MAKLSTTSPKQLMNPKEWKGIPISMQYHNLDLTTLSPKPCTGWCATSLAPPIPTERLAEMAANPNQQVFIFPPKNEDEPANDKISD